MKLDVVPESLLERALLASGAVPVPLIHTMGAILMARTIMSAVRLGLFDHIGATPRTAEEIAESCGTDPRATEKLLSALVGLGYVDARRTGYVASALSRKWLGDEASTDLTHAVLHRFLDARLMEASDSYLRTGEPTRFHQSLSGEDWLLYMDGQRAHAALMAHEITRRVAIKPTDEVLLDVGGGHGLLSDALCKAHPSLRAVVFDLPDALARVDRTIVSDRVSFRDGDARRDELGESAFDVVLVANLIHHFTEDENRRLIARCAGALKPGGRLIVADLVRRDPASTAGQIPALLDFYFAVTSGGGAWTADEVTGWLEAAKLVEVRARNLRRAPGMALISGTARDMLTPIE